MVRIGDHDEYMVNSPYCSVVRSLENSGSVMKERHLCKMLHMVYALDALTSLDMLSLLAMM